MADRKADVFAGAGSIAERLKRRREMIEAGDLINAPAAFTGKLKIQKPKKK